MAKQSGTSKRGRPSLAEMASRIGTREGLLQATRDLMITKDSVEFSLSEIAEITGQSPALVQYHFGNKEGLLLALIELDAIKAVDEMRGLAEMDLPTNKKMRMHIGGLINAYFVAPYANRLLHALMQNSSPESAQRVSDIFLRPVAEFQRDLLEKGAREGLFREINPMDFYFIVVGSCDQFFSRRGALAYVFGVQEITEDLKRRFIHTLADTIMAGIAA